MTVSKELLEEVKQKVDLIELIQERVVLKKKGVNYVGLCPFHAERTGSFFVSPQKRFYYCFGCKQSGDAYSFIMQTQGLNFVESFSQLALRVNIPIPAGLKSSPLDEQQKEHINRMYRLNRFVLEYFQKGLQHSARAQEYLQSRGIPEELQRQFCIGYADGSWDGLYLYLQKAKAPIDVAATLGLVKQKKNLEWKDNFVGRVIFPIINLQGRVCGFAGRLLQSLDQGAKYLNSPESVIFNKSKLLFGFYQAQKYIKQQDEVIIVEGYTDMLSLFQVGLCHSVATCGTSLTTAHLELLKKHCSKMIVLYDGDRAGQEALYKAMIVGLQANLILYGAKMPLNMDPNDLIMQKSTGSVSQEGCEQLKALLIAAKPIIDLKLQEIFETCMLDLSDEQSFVTGVKQMAELVSLIQDPVSRQQREQRILNKYKISVQLWKTAIKQIRTQSSAEKTSDQVVIAPRESLDRVDECMLMALAYGEQYFSVFESIFADVPLNVWEVFVSPSAKDFIKKVIEKFHGIKIFQMDLDAILQECAHPQIKEILFKKILSEDLCMDHQSFYRMLLSRKKQVLQAYTKRLLQYTLKSNDEAGEADLLKRIEKIARLQTRY